MGRPKALVRVDGVPMARRVADAMLRAGAERVVLVGGSGSIGLALDLEVIDDLWPGEGPLGGLASAAAWADEVGASTLLVAACDQPNLTPQVFELLQRSLATDVTAGGSGVAGSVTVAGDGRHNPFPAAWRSSASTALSALVAGGARRADAALGLGTSTVSVADVVVADVDRPEDVPRGRTGRAEDEQ